MSDPIVLRSASGAESEPMREEPMGHLHAWARPDAHRDRALESDEARSWDAAEERVHVAAEQREPTCWMPGCGASARTWVLDVGFDRKEIGARLQFAQVSSAGYGGPVPGFCRGHLASGPALLAERVYWDAPLVRWGYMPARWYARLTDGTDQRGPIHQVNPTGAQPHVVDEHMRQQGAS